MCLCISPTPIFLHRQFWKLLQMIRRRMSLTISYLITPFLLLPEFPPPTESALINHLSAFCSKSVCSTCGLCKKHYHNPHESFQQAPRLTYCENARAASRSSSMHNSAILIWGFACCSGGWWRRISWFQQTRDACNKAVGRSQGRGMFSSKQKSSPKC